jgi:hypothetical protein
MNRELKLHNIVTSLIFTIGVIDFIAGDFVISTMLFGLACLGFIGK